MSRIRKLLTGALAALTFSSSANAQQEIPKPTPRPNIEQSQQVSNDVLPMPRIFSEYLHKIISYQNNPNSERFSLQDILEIEQIVKYIRKIPEHKRVQSQKDFIDIWDNQIKYEIIKPYAIAKINQILSNHYLNNMNKLKELLDGRMRKGMKPTNQTPNLSTIVFYPNADENGKALNRLLLQYIPNPHKIKVGADNKHPIPESMSTKVMYPFFVALALLENNFGNTTESSANAKGPLQIKDNTIKTVSNVFKVSKDNDNFQESVEASILEIIRIARLYDIDLTSQRITTAEIILLSYSYFQGADSYTTFLTEPSGNELNKIIQYPFVIHWAVEESVINNFLIIQETPQDNNQN